MNDSSSPGCPPTQTPDDIDLPALREKYRRSATSVCAPKDPEQYLELVDEFADFYETDPHSPPLVRDPISEDIDVAVLGGGFAGLMCAAYLKQAGVDDFRIIELGGDFGGVWYWNRYPGIQCDNDSYCYLPLLEELATCRARSSPTAPRSSSTASASASTSACTTARCSTPWSAPCAGTRRSSAGGSAPTAATTSAPASSSWPRARSTGRSCRASPASRTSRATSSTPSRWDYDYTGGDTHRRAGQAGRQDGRDHRHRRDRHPGGPASSAGTAEQLYVFQRTPSSSTRATTADRSGMGRRSLQPGLAAGAAAQLPRRDVRGNGAGQPTRLRLLDRAQPQHSPRGCSRWPDPAAMTPEQFMAMREDEDYKVMERLRRRVDEPRRGPGDRRGAEAVVPVPVQAAVLQRRVSADLQPAERHAGRRVGHQGRRADHREGHCRQRRRVRGRLHHLRQWLRDHHRDQPPLRHRRDRGPRRPVALRPLGATATRPCTA